MKYINRGGKSSSKIYNAWNCMFSRIKHSPYYKNIKVCKRWSGRYGFNNFVKDMGERPDGMTLERLHNDRDYKPSNCIWASWLDQHKNKRNNRWITIKNKTRIIAEWAAISGINPWVLNQRIRRGWDPEDAVFYSSQRQER